VTAAAAGHGGELALHALARFGVTELFTLSGGHLFPFFDAAVKRGVRLVDVRHEQTAVFAAEATAKLTCRPGVAALTAGPGITNGISATATAWFNGSPLVVLGGRAGDQRWGAGALQELDHVPVLAPITKFAGTVHDVDAIASSVHDAAVLASTPHRGPVFLDFPLDVLFATGRSSTGQRDATVDVVRGAEPDPDEVARAVSLLANAQRPALIAGTDVYWGGAWEALTAAVETLRVPTFANGMGRGCLPADHELAFSRTRAQLREADVVVVVGTPLDFRLGFGDFGAAQVVHVVDAADRRATHATVAVSPAGDLVTILRAFADHRGPCADHEPWIARLRDAERAEVAADAPRLAAGGEPIQPARVYGELRAVLDRDAVVVCDGGDFVSYAGKYLDSYVPGHWLDPGPYGCLGTAMGYALAARLARPDKQVVVMLGDGAAGFSLMDADTLVRHGIPVVIVIGNNGIWGLEKYPMQQLYGYDVAAELRPGTRYDQVVTALGGGGEVVERAGDLRAALARGFAAGVPYVLNVITDPTDAYPRRSRLG
jgi:acetolactate synthase-1/2/3 large subunit